jgi:hypothetical protein
MTVQRDRRPAQARDYPRPVRALQLDVRGAPAVDALRRRRRPLPNPT